MIKEKRTTLRQSRAERSAEKLQYWETQIEAWRTSGLSQEKFCTTAGLSYSSFKYWIPRKARPPFEMPSGGRFIPAIVVAPESPSSCEAHKCSNGPGESPPGAQAPLEIRFSSGERIEISPGFDAPTLERVIEIMRRCHV